MDYVSGAFIILVALSAPPLIVLRLLPQWVPSKFGLACWSATSASLGFSEGLLVVYSLFVIGARGGVVSYAAAIFQAALFGVLFLCTIGVLTWIALFCFVPRQYLPLASNRSARSLYGSVALVTSICAVALAACGLRLPTP
jgi:hypothetical protein